MGLSLQNKAEINRYLKQMAIRIEAILVRELFILVAQLQNHAKLSAEYEDQTANLKGSIGGAVLKDGVPLKYAGFDTAGKEGNATGLEFINSLIAEQGSGYAIIVVAGQEYASYVEDGADGRRPRNVLKKTELKMQREIEGIFTRMKAQIEI